MQFREVIGQNQIKQRLCDSFNQGRIPHAQLFSGVEGNGKMALALAYAQYVNCANRTDSDSCGVCASCVKYAKFEHPDLHFVFPVVKKSSSATISDHYIKEWRSYLQDTAYVSINGWVNQLNAENKQPQIYADESVSIVNKLSKRAYEAEYKVMIIYSPERMNITCSNKLLKLIEEPSPKTLILLVSDTPEDIITTILSRCQNIAIPPIKAVDMSAALVERDHLDADSAKRIGRMASGSYIRAQEMLVQDANEQYNFENFRALMRLAFKKDVLGLKHWSDDMSKRGREQQKHFFIYAQHVVRESFMANFRNEDLSYVSPIEAEFISKFAPFANENNVAAMLGQMEDAQFHVERNVSSKMVFFDLALKFTALVVKRK